MSEEKPEGERASAAGLLLKEHAVVSGRVAMALLGDAGEVERVLEQVAREAGSQPLPPADRSSSRLAWLLGLVRAASAAHLSKLPLRTRPGAHDAAPATERMGAGEAIPAREALAALPPTEREAVVLSLIGGLDAVDVAAACNVDVGTAKTRIARGAAQMLENASSRRDGEAS